MCGGDGSIRIEPAENGFSIDSYTPGNGDKPGRHKKLIASTPQEVAKLLIPHLAKARTRGTRVSGGEAPMSLQSGKTRGKKKGAGKRKALKR